MKHLEEKYLEHATSKRGAPGVGFEPTWFSVLDWMNPRNSPSGGLFESDKLTIVHE